MTYVIAVPWVDVLDRACVDECPVDCIYEGKRSLYIHPDECVDCGACEPVCPVEAIYYEDDVPAQWETSSRDNARFFAEPLPGRAEALGSPGGAPRSGRPVPTPSTSPACHCTRPD
jgi:NAD-dependent dihydropyrimidine dehydrogenase PreA subunit